MTRILKVAFVFYRGFSSFKLLCNVRFEHFVKYDIRLHKFIQNVPKIVWISCNSKLKGKKRSATFVFDMETDLEIHEESDHETDIRDFMDIEIGLPPRHLDERSDHPDFNNWKIKLNKTCSYIDGCFEKNKESVAILYDESDEYFELSDFVLDDFIPDKLRGDMLRLNAYVEDVLMAKVRQKAAARQEQARKLRELSELKDANKNLGTTLQSLNENDAFIIRKDINDEVVSQMQIHLLRKRMIKEGWNIGKEQLDNIILLISMKFIEYDSFKLSNDNERVILNEPFGNAYGDWIISRNTRYYNGKNFKYRITRLDSDEVY